MDHNEAGCQAPDRPILCVNNCGFFGSATTRNMCSKCHKEAVLREQHVHIAASSIETFVNGSTRKSKETLITGAIDVSPGSTEAEVVVSCNSSAGQTSETKKHGPSRCTTCSKRVGLTGFSCRCGNMFCAAHRYSDKHDCPFDYRAAAQTAIARANPIIKAEKLDMI